MMTEDFFPEHHKPGLFRSHAWLAAWKKSWGDHQAIEWLSDTFTDQPTNSLSTRFCRTRIMKCGILPLETAFPVGISTPVASSIRSEYFFFPDSEELAEGRVTTYLDSALAYSWDQFYLPDLLLSSPEYPLLLQIAKAKDLYVVHEQIGNTYGIDVSHGDFAQFLKGLGKNTRLKLFNRRKNLAQFGEITIENIWPDRQRFYQLLDGFHEKRWGKTCYRGRNIPLVDSLLDNLSEQGHKIDLSVLSVAGKPVSVLFDIGINGRQYNLQSGYQENFGKSISLGKLHFGYQIEAAFNNTAIDFYDFMAGNGKHADYKKFMSTHGDQLASLLLIRSPWLKLIYKIRKKFSRA